jgi:DNA-binding transcriptional MerR regulator
LTKALRRAKRILLLRSIGIPVEGIVVVLEKADRMDESVLKSRLEELREERKAIDEQISVASMLLLLDEMSSDTEVRDELLDRMFEKVCRDE